MAKCHVESWAASRVSAESWATAQLTHDRFRIKSNDSCPLDVNREQEQDDVENHTSSACVFLSLTAMPTIVGASQEWLDLMRTEKEMCLGRTINVITGPETNNRLLEDLIKCTQKEAQLLLYPVATGLKTLCSVRAQEVARSGTSCAQRVCKLTMRPLLTQAVPYQSAVLEDQVSSKMIIEAAEPHHVVHVSNSFEKHLKHKIREAA